jgi:hypothetical protein
MLPRALGPFALFVSTIFVVLSEKSRVKARFGLSTSTIIFPPSLGSVLTELN